MTLQQAIEHCKEKAKEQRNDYLYGNYDEDCLECAQDHEQLANWLIDYERLLEKQQPKKCENIETPVVTWGVCPVCHGLPPLLGKQRRIFSSENYCSNCGQRIDWTEV